MRYFFDTEFIEDGITIDLISIGIISEDRRTYYAENIDCDLGRADPWVQNNVVPHLVGPTTQFTRPKIARDIRAFVGENPEFWGYYCDYDWVLMCQLFGRMIDLPRGWPKFCLDLKQEMVRLKINKEDLPKQEGLLHHALDDAMWIRSAWKFIRSRA